MAVLTTGVKPEQKHNLPNQMSGSRFPSTYAGTFVPGVGRLDGWGSTNPSDGDSGWAPGASFKNTTSGAGQFLINEGTLASCEFIDVSSEALNAVLGTTGTDASQASLTINSEAASKGSLILKSSDHSSNYDVTITNGGFGQTSILTIPDPGSSIGTFILNTGNTGIVWSAGATTARALDYQATTSSTTDGVIMRVGTGISGKIPFTISGMRGFALYMDNTATSGTFTGMRLRSGVNPSSGANSIDNLLCQVSVESSKDATTINSGFFEIVPKGTNVIGTARGLLVNIDSAATVTYSSQLTAAHIRMHTRGDETMSGVDEMLRLENEAVGGNGRTLDSFIRCMGTTLSGGIKGADYLIDGGTGTDLLGTAVLRLPDDEVTAWDDANGAGDTAAGAFKVVIGSAVRYVKLYSDAP